MASLRDNMKKYDSEHSKGGGTKFWKPSPGRNRIVIMPGYTNKDGKFVPMPWQARGVHFQAPNGEAVGCPRITTGDQCKLCDAFFEAKAGKGNSEDEETCKASTYHLFNIVDYNDKTAGVQVWQCPYGLYEELRGLMDDPDVYNLNGPKSWMLHNPVIQFNVIGKGKSTKYRNVRDYKKIKMSFKEFHDKMPNLRAIARNYLPSYEDTCRAYGGESLMKKGKGKDKSKGKAGFKSKKKTTGK